MRTGVSIGPKWEYVEELPEELDFVELSMGELEIDPEEIDSERFRDILDEKEFGLIVHLPFRQPLSTTVEEFNDAEIEYLDRLLEFSSELGAEKAVIHPNLRYGQDKEEVRKTLKRQVKKLSKAGERHGVEVVFENIPFEDTRPADLEEFGELMEELEAPVCLDTGHAFAEGGQEALEDFLENYGHLISHLHVQDTREGKDLHMPVGSAEIDFESAFENLEEFDGTATLELFTGDEDYILLSREKFHESLG